MSKSYFNDWYINNKDEFNAKRRERYKNDKKHREVVKARSAETKRLRKGKCSEPVDKVLGGYLVRCYPTSYVARVVGRHPSVIRSWEKAGYIPKPTIPGYHRFYTPMQFILLKMIGEALNINDFDQRQSEIKKVLKQIEKDWCRLWV